MPAPLGLVQRSVGPFEQAGHRAERARLVARATSLLMIALIRRQHPDEFQWIGANRREPNLLTIERHGGTARLRQAIEAGTLSELLREWERDQETFREKRAPYLIYR